jgi:hypothetical protein
LEEGGGGGTFFNPNTGEVQAGESQVWGQSGLQSKNASSKQQQQQIS